MAKRNKKIKNQILQKLKSKNLLNVIIQNENIHLKDDSNLKFEKIEAEDVESFFPINQKDLLKVFINTILILIILTGFYYIQLETNYTSDYTEKFRLIMHF